MMKTKLMLWKSVRKRMNDHQVNGNLLINTAFINYSLC